MRCRRRRQRGFTLVEMMIALLLFTFAIAGVLSVAVTMSAGFREQRQVIATEGSVRAPMDFLADAIRMASPAVPTGNIQDGTTCTIASGAGVGGLSVINNAAAPDSIDITYAYGAVITSLRNSYDGTVASLQFVNDDNQAGQISIGDTLLVTNMTQGTLVHVTANPTLVPAPDATVAIAPYGGACAAISYPPGSFIIRVLRARFYVALDPANADPINNIGGVPTLYMDPDADGPAGGEPLAEGIEDMQIALGVDTDNDGSINPATEWFSGPGMPLAGNLRAIRITLVARSKDPLPGAGTTSFRPAAEDRPIAATGDAFRRRVLTSTIEVRNLQGSP